MLSPSKPTTSFRRCYNVVRTSTKLFGRQKGRRLNVVTTLFGHQQSCSDVKKDVVRTSKRTSFERYYNVLTGLVTIKVKIPAVKELRG